MWEKLSEKVPGTLRHAETHPAYIAPGALLFARLRAPLWQSLQRQLREALPGAPSQTLCMGTPLHNPLAPPPAWRQVLCQATLMRLLPVLLLGVLPPLPTFLHLYKRGLGAMLWQWVSGWAGGMVGDSSSLKFFSSQQIGSPPTPPKQPPYQLSLDAGRLPRCHVPQTRDR
jgi:hypothetical protein